jgi:hypothetical protein
VKKSRFVRPDTTTLTLKNGDTLVVKKRLNNGERRAEFARMYLAGVDGRLKVNLLETGMAKVVAYLLDWSFADEGGKKVEIAGLSQDDLAARVDALDEDSFTEIKEAIEAHEIAMTEAREKEKNDQGGESTSSAISSSPAPTAGATSGSPS